MSASETETVSLNLDGSFAANAAKAAAAAEKCDNALKKLGSGKTGVDAADASMKKLAQDSDAADKAMHKLKAAQDQQEKARKAMLASQGRNDQGQSWAAADKAGSSISAGGTVLAGAAGLALAAGAKLMDAAYEMEKAKLKMGLDLGMIGGKMAIAESGKRDLQTAIMKKLGGSYDATVSLALKLGIDSDDAVEQTKKLLASGFSKREIPVLMKIKAGMDAAGFDGDALFKKLETIKLGSKVSAKDIEGLKKLGIDVGKVYEEMARASGQSVDAVKAKVKKGTADAGQMVAAIEKVAGAKFGPIANILGNSIPALLTRIAVRAKELFAFDGKQMDPIKKELNGVIAMLEGSVGQELKASLGALFGAVSGVFAGNQKEMIAEVRELAAELRQLAKVIHENEDGIRKFMRALAQMKAADIESMIKHWTEVAKGAGKAGEATERAKKAAEEIKKKTGMGDSPIGPGGLPGGDGAEKWQVSLDAGDAAKDALGDKGADVGDAMSKGLTDGIANGESAAVTAAVAMVTNAIAAARAAADAHSPSRIMANLGDVGFGGGLVAGMDAANDNVGKAGAKLAGAGMGGAAAGMGAVPAAGAGGGKAGGAGGAPITITVTAGPNASAQDVAKEVVIKLRELQAEAA